jgi:Ca-activated chloride channel family protein
MDGLGFATPALLWLVVLVPVVGLLTIRWQRHPAVSVGSVADALSAPVTWRVRGERLLPFMRLLALAALVVAIAGPRHGVAGAETTGEGVDIALAFDISASMTLPYVRNESRLDAAKDVLSSFVESRNGDRVGLVVFQASSLTLSPLSSDYAAVATDIRDADHVQLRDGTAIGLAIAQSAALLRESTAASRIVILLTDGENNVHDVEPLEAARIAQALGVRVYVIGVGGGTGVPDSARFNVDERAMRQIAQITGGTYNRAEDPASLRDTYNQIDRLERSRLPGAQFTRFDDWSPFVLAAAAALLALELVLRCGPLRRPA